MNLKIKLILLFLACLNMCYAKDVETNIAYYDNNVRFTVISNGAIRLEYSPDGTFVDDKSFVAVKRNYPQVQYKIRNTKSFIEITTTKLKLKYKKNSGKFSSDNLSITSEKGIKPFIWKPGKKQHGNLKGTYRTLDRYDGDLLDGKEKMPMEDGLLATDGWTLIDDSKNFLFDNSEWAWVKVRPENNGQDWYFLGYGNDYKSALKDFTLFAGKVPLPPKYAFGYWWSRYWSYSDEELRNLVSNFHRYDIPLDVLVIDMDWHYTESGKGGWTGWTWNRRLFPNPKRLLEDLKANNLKVTLNLHPADGVAAYEEQYKTVAKDMGIDPNSKQNIPWINSDKKFINTIFKDILDPMQKWGVDFWWLDWQQALDDPKILGLSNTWYINYSFFSHAEQTWNTRPLLYHRWGGLGNHRYQVGFSGDAVISWKSLDFQPYFNSTASNVLYGYWSHDIGGHQGADKIEPEMYIRWLQFGALSPIMRTHSTKNGGLNKEPWVFDKEYMEIICNTIKQRYELVPYIYTMARKDYDEAISLCRPMYYDYPISEEAYNFRNEYMFGDNILVAPITQPMNNRYSTLKVWLPKGKWYEWYTGTLLEGDQIIERSFAIDEYPIYVKSGSIIPMYSKSIKNLAESNKNDIILTIYPGHEGSFNLYEDNGDNKNYDKKYSKILLENRREGNSQIISIGKRLGQYDGMPTTRNYEVRVLSANVPLKVYLNGKSIDYTYSGNDLAICIKIADVDCSKNTIIKIEYPRQMINLNGVIGKSKRLRKALEQLKYRDSYIVLNDTLGSMGSLNMAIQYDPQQMPFLVSTFMQNYKILPEVLKSQNLSKENQDWFLKYIHWKEYK